MERGPDGTERISRGERPAVRSRASQRPDIRDDAGRAVRRQPPLAGKALKDAVAARARALGFEAVRVTTPDRTPASLAQLQAWLGAGHHGSMEWMASTPERRADPRALWPEVRSIVMLGLNYGPAGDPLATLARLDRGAISAYARGRDYHEVIKGKLKEVAGFLVARAGGDVKVFVDTAPVMEKPLAEAAGLGWQGKHTVLVSRELGNWLFLGAIFTTVDLPPDPAEVDHCGSCRRCLDICPTGAFPAPYRLDARRCISYLTIEHGGPIPAELRPLMGNRIFGCDDCLAVCPWNKFAEASREAKLQARADLDAPPLAELAGLDDAAFRARFAGSPIKRTGRERFVRNVLIAIGNSGDARLAEEAIRLIDDPSVLVRGAAIWAIERLLPADAVRSLAARRAAGEPDGEVRAEWDRACLPPEAGTDRERSGWRSVTQAVSEIEATP